MKKTIQVFVYWSPLCTFTKRQTRIRIRRFSVVYFSSSMLISS